MIHPVAQLTGMLLGGLLTLSLFTLNIISLLRGRRVFRGPRSCRLKTL
ncbi:MAG: hypothetical protein J6C98_05595 [Oscillospiraceae bacterium]|nr:hypothetical protein [Oscillospiraceae bacterium]